MRISKKILACVLAALMAISMMPITALADGNVATIGGTGYATIAEAYAACQPGQTITLVDDITGPVEFNRRTDNTITRDDVFTLDLNGHSITAPSGQHALKLCMKHQLVIADSSEGHTGRIQASGNGNAIYLGYKVGSNYNIGKITITGGTIQAVARAIYNPSSTCRIVVDGEYVNIVSTNVDAIGINKSSADLEIHNGTIDGKNNGVYVYTSSEVTIDGGEISGEYAASIKTASTLAISGGAFEGTTSALNYTGTKTGFISGGTFSDDISEYVVEGYTGVKNGDGKYTVDSIDGYVAKVDGVLYETLEAAHTAAQSGDTITLLTDININNSSDWFAISKSLIIDGNNHTVTIKNRGFGVGVGAAAPIDVTFKNITINNTTKPARCIDTRGNLSSLTLDNATLSTVGSSGQWVQPLTIGGNQATTATVTIKDSTIMDSVDGSVYYAIITFNPVAMTITNSTIKGWACIYAKGPNSSEGSAGSVFTIKDSTLVSKNKNSGETNSFSMFIAEDDNVTVNVTDSVIDITATGDQSQAIASTQANSGLADFNVYLGAGNDVTLPVDDADFADNEANVIVSGGSFNVPVPAEYCAEGYASKATPDAQGKYTVGVPDNGTSISVADEISENFYLDDDFYGEEAYVAITSNKNSNASEQQDFQTEVKSMASLPDLDDPESAYDGAKMLSVIQAPAQSTEPIIINVYASQEDAIAGKNAVDTIQYSVYNYCKKIIDDYEGEKKDEMKALAKATLDYAAAAQTYFDYNTGDMATKDAGGDFYGDVTEVDFEGVAGISERPSSIIRATVVVKSDLEINLLSKTPISAEDGSSIDSSKATKFNVSTLPKNGSFYGVAVKGIEPANMNKTITVKTTEGDIVLTANAIMKAMSASNDANMVTLAKAMYLYGQAADNYFKA